MIGIGSLTPNRSLAGSPTCLAFEPPPLLQIRPAPGPPHTRYMSPSQREAAPHRERCAMEDRLAGDALRKQGVWQE